MTRATKVISKTKQNIRHSVIRRTHEHASLRDIPGPERLRLAEKSVGDVRALDIPNWQQVLRLVEIVQMRHRLAKTRTIAGVNRDQGHAAHGSPGPVSGDDSLRARKERVIIAARGWEQQDLVTFLDDLLNGPNSGLVLEHCEHLLQQQTGQVQ